MAALVPLNSHRTPPASQPGAYPSAMLEGLHLAVLLMFFSDILVSLARAFHTLLQLWTRFILLHGNWLVLPC